MQRLKQGIIQGAGLGALVVCVGACLVTPIDNTTDTESESESEGDEDSTTEEDETNTPSNPPTNPTEVDAETGVTSTGTTTPDPTDTDTDPDTQGGVCGDSNVDRGEACDDGVNDGSYGGCAADCQSPGPMCGDNNVDDGNEVCDDGVNDGSYGGCAADCQAPGPFCGDGSLDDGEEACDDGNDIDDDECSNTCEAAICGDGIVQPGLGEVCDDEVNDGSYGGCAADCLSFGPFCGDGIIDEVEACDDTNMDSQDGCLGDCTVPQNCKQVHEFDDVAPDGVYMLSVDGTAWSAYCDMTTDGGGWTLAAKVAPTNSWQYSSARWTDNSLLSADKTGFDHIPAKLQTWNLVPFTQIHLGMEPTGNPDAPLPAYITLDVGANSLFELFSPNTYVPTAATHANWITLMPEASLQEACDQEGINNAAMGGDTTPRVRLGILSDDADDCSSPNSVLGVGFGNLPSPCMNNPFTSGGNLNCGNPPVKRQGFGWIFVR